MQEEHILEIDKIVPRTLKGLGHPFWLLACLIALKGLKGKKRDIVLQIFSLLGRLVALATANLEMPPELLFDCLRQTVVRQIN